jgi:cyclic beta-1,2-glucan synthetase
VITAFIGVFQILKGTNPRTAFASTWYSLLRWLLALTFLPYEAFVHLNAIAITLVRMFFERRKLLQWTTVAQASRRLGEQTNPNFTWRRMVVASLISSILSLVLLFVNPQRFLIAVPFLLLWMISPEIAYWISRPIQIKRERLSKNEIASLRRLARLTWLFFEKFGGPEDHWLPPDHFQESPRGDIAHRTSPTNIGLGLLSTLGAYDFGYIELVDVVARTRLTFDTLKRLERYRGHFLNWYDTRTLDPLQPAYISTVDSGNLAAGLITLAQGCQSLVGKPLFRRELWQGLADSLGMIIVVLDSLNESDAWESARTLRAYLLNFTQQLRSLEETPQTWYRSLIALTRKELLFRGEGSEEFNIRELDRRLISLVESYATELGVGNIRRLRIYASQFTKHIEGIERQVDLLMPWLALFEDIPHLIKVQVRDEELALIFRELQENMPRAPSLLEIDGLLERVQKHLNKLRRNLAGIDCEPSQKMEAQGWLSQLEEKIRSADIAAKTLRRDLNQLYRVCQDYTEEMDFTFLFDRQRKVFHLGYNLGLDRLDSNHYDLLASEARIASLLAIAKDDVSQTHWLHLGRPVTRVDGTLVLVSWSGTLFEYLMPDLLHHNYDGTLLAQSARAVIDIQIRYARSRNIPWGFSESAYYSFDNNQNYQYRAFGVPELGYKRGLADDLVVAPYASFLALPRRPAAVLENFERLKELGMLGIYGLYESVDFTPIRLPPGDDHSVIRSYMAHHQGMILLSLVNFIKNNIMINRFHSDPRIRSVEILLQEKIPLGTPLEKSSQIDSQIVQPAAARVEINPWRVSVNPAQPRPHILSNGRYSVMITSTGGGFSRWRDVDLTRWRSDSTLDNWGSWIYVQDLDHPQRALWSVTRQPTGRRPLSQDVTFDAYKAEFHRRDGDISLIMDVTVPPDDDLEIRRLTVTNHSDQPRHLRLTSYAEIILASQSTDERHPTFNKLFIESGFLPEINGILFHRRLRNDSEEPLFLAHVVVMESGYPQGFAFESNREKFLGRGLTTRRPRALRHVQHSLSGSTGATLDPIACLSSTLELQPHRHAQLAFLTLAANSKQSIVDLAKRYALWHNVEWAFAGARNHAEMELRKLGLTGSELSQIQRLLSVLVYPHHALRAAPEILSANRKGQSGLWGQSISGDHPILLVRIQGSDGLPLVLELLRAHAFWRNRLFKVDLVLLNEEGTQYSQELNSELNRLIISQKTDSWLNRRGGIFVLNSDQMDEMDRVLLQTAARAVLDGSGGSLARQLRNLSVARSRLPSLVTTASKPEDLGSTPPLRRSENLQFDNGLGGASPDGREYLIYLSKRRNTPLPWVNVIANERFGFMVSEAGSATTWATNSSENRLTPWSNDPVTDPSGEVIYLRDEETGEVWTPTPLPARSPAPYLVRHGAGYTIFEHNSHGLSQRLRLFIDPHDPVKILHLRLRNLLDRPRRITATYYAEWVLGVHRSDTQQFVICEYDAESQALLARNSYHTEYAERVAFAAASKPLHGLTADRTEFLGRMGSYRRPAALSRIGLAGVVEAGIDPCAALQLHLDLPPGGSEEVFFLLGQGDNRENALQLVGRYKKAEGVARAWHDLKDFWDRILDALTVQTPDPALNFMLNRWLLYQTLSCRIFGRSAFYQSSGAFGFRDQLQDVLALLFSAPEMARSHILLSAGHQFESGDVLHWWHPPSGRGVRTHSSDDLIWLPYATAQYIETTGDLSILFEEAPFKQGLPLDGEEERYGLFVTSEERYPLLDHCHRALTRGFNLGPHGLPLIGTGDWNDGMNRVGAEGRGESVWLGWFLNVTLNRFAWICDLIGEDEQARLYRQQAAGLIQSIDEYGWDGQWYLRAFYDDGTPLGSAQNRECRIDSIAQSWSVFSGEGDPVRSRRAMQSLFEHLVRKEDGLILLLTPPFDKTLRDPGYIRGYLPGVRENGGQYTHAALWTVWAFAELGEGTHAGDLLELLNPIYHADTYRKALQYKVEPYVISADIYGVPPNVGRGGWTWYTGSSGWMYRLGTETILGLHRRGDTLMIEPCIPAAWAGYQVRYRFGKSIYHIEIRNPAGLSRGLSHVTLDGNDLPDGKIPLRDDGRDHHIIADLGTYPGFMEPTPHI